MEAITILVLLTFFLTILLKKLNFNLSKSTQKWRTRISSSLFLRQPTSPSYNQNIKDIPTPPLHETPAYILPSLQSKTAAATSMGLKRLDNSNWLTLDSNYQTEHVLRTSFLATNYENVIQWLPPTKEACYEVLSLVTTFLSTRFPQHFTITSTPFGPQITNHLTSETYAISPETCTSPLEIAARLAMEDLNILMQNEEGEYCLMASATLFPAGWKLKERIGSTMASLHAPVPGWKENLSRSVNRYFTHLTPRTSMERCNLFIQSTPHLFIDSPEAPRSHISPNQLYVRRERQTFRRLEKSGAVLFTVRTYMQGLMQVQGGEVEALKQQIGRWEGVVGRYKGSDVWGEAFGKWCEETGGMAEEEVNGLNSVTKLTS